MINAKEAQTCGLILRHVLYGEDAGPFPSDTDWAKLRSIVELHRLESLVDCSSDPALSPLRKPEFAFSHALYQRTQRETVRKLFLEMKKRGIRAALLKGLELESCYPAGCVRTSNDIDLFIPGKQRQAFSQMMRELNIPLESDVYHCQTGADTYQTAGGMKIEAHYILFYRMGAQKRKLLRELGFFSDRFFVPGGAAELDYETYCPQAHLLYLVYHTAQHLLTHNLRLQMLADLTVYVNRYAESIDASELQRTLNRLGLMRIANALFCFCVRYLGMRRDFWRRTGPTMEFMLRRMMDNGPPHLWVRAFKQYRWAFYPIECIEKDQEYFIRYTYHPLRAFTGFKPLATFIAWGLVRLVWKLEVDTCGDAT